MLKNFNNVKIGTRLLVRSDLIEGKSYDSWGVNREMAKYIGQPVTCSGFKTYVGGAVMVENMLWGWSSKMFECIIDDDISLLDLLSEGGTGNADTSD